MPILLSVRPCGSFSIRFNTIFGKKLDLRVSLEYHIPCGRQITGSGNISTKPYCLLTALECQIVQHFNFRLGVPSSLPHL
jgi:hypothetical protein